MSDSDLGEEEQHPEEEPKSHLGEGGKAVIQEILKGAIVEKNLTFESASKCLNTLGKDESGVRYAYLMLSAIDKKLTDISIIINFKHLLMVDLSGNFLNLDAIQVATNLPFLIYLKAQRNMIESANLHAVPYLQVLSLAKNQVTDTCQIEQPMLECLDLNYNEIYTVQFDEERLPVLKQLELRGNQMFDLSGDFPKTLEILYMAENKISRFVPNDLSRLALLRILHLRDNNIRKLDGFSEKLANLNYLNLRQNKINKFRQFRKLKCLPALETLIVSKNPVAGDLKSDEDKGEEADDESEMGEDQDKEDITRIPLILLLPNLRRINKVTVTYDEREEAKEGSEERLEEIMQEESSEDEQHEMVTTTDYTPGNTTEMDEYEGEEEEGELGEGEVIQQQ